MLVSLGPSKLSPDTEVEPAHPDCEAQHGEGMNSPQENLLVGKEGIHTRQPPSAIISISKTCLQTTRGPCIVQETLEPVS